MTAAGPDRYAQVQAATAALFEGDVAVRVVDPRAPQPALMEAEAAHVSRAIPARQREFAAGRAAIRAAMAALGKAPSAVPAGEDRAPIWSDGINGTLSHSATLCVAVLTTSDVSLGIDIEEDTPLPEDLITAICSPTEIARLRGRDQGRMARLIFAAKEAAYKAQYPLSRALFGFDHLDVSIDADQQRFTATFVKPAAPFVAGTVLTGRFAFAAGHVIAAVTADHPALRKG